MQIKVGASVRGLTRNAKFFGARTENVRLFLNCSFLLEKVDRAMVHARNNAMVPKVHCKYMRRISTFTNRTRKNHYIPRKSTQILPFPIRKERIEEPLCAE